MNKEDVILAGTLGGGLLAGGYLLLKGTQIGSGQKLKNRIYIYPTFEVNDYIDSLAQAYGTDYFCDSAIVTIEGIDDNGDTVYDTSIDMTKILDYQKKVPSELRDEETYRYDWNVRGKPVILDLSPLIEYININISVQFNSNTDDLSYTDEGNYAIGMVLRNEGEYTITDIIRNTYVSPIEKEDDVFQYSVNKYPSVRINLFYNDQPLSEALQPSDPQAEMFYMSNFDLYLSSEGDLKPAYIGQLLLKPDILSIYNDQIELPLYHDMTPDKLQEVANPPDPSNQLYHIGLSTASIEVPILNVEEGTYDWEDGKIRRHNYDTRYPEDDNRHIAWDYIEDTKTWVWDIDLYKRYTTLENLYDYYDLGEPSLALTPPSDYEHGNRDY